MAVRYYYNKKYDSTITVDDYGSAELSRRQADRWFQAGYVEVDKDGNEIDTTGHEKGKYVPDTVPTIIKVNGIEVPVSNPTLKEPMWRYEAREKARLEEEARIAAEKKAEEERLAEEKRKKEEAEAKKKAEEEAKRKAKEEAERALEEAAKAEAKKKKEEEDAKIKAEQEEADRQYRERQKKLNDAEGNEDEVEEVSSDWLDGYLDGGTNLNQMFDEEPEETKDNDESKEDSVKEEIEDKDEKSDEEPVKEETEDEAEEAETEEVKPETEVENPEDTKEETEVDGRETSDAKTEAEKSAEESAADTSVVLNPEDKEGITISFTPDEGLVDSVNEKYGEDEDGFHFGIHRESKNDSYISDIFTGKDTTPTKLEVRKREEAKRKAEEEKQRAEEARKQAEAEEEAKRREEEETVKKVATSDNAEVLPFGARTRAVQARSEAERKLELEKARDALLHTSIVGPMGPVGNMMGIDLDEVQKRRQAVLTGDAHDVDVTKSVEKEHVESEEADKINDVFDDIGNEADTDAEDVKPLTDEETEETVNDEVNEPVKEEPEQTEEHPEEVEMEEIPEEVEMEEIPEDDVDDIQFAGTEDGVVEENVDNGNEGTEAEVSTEPEEENSAETSDKVVEETPSEGVEMLPESDEDIWNTFINADDDKDSVEELSGNEADKVNDMFDDIDSNSDDDASIDEEEEESATMPLDMSDEEAEEEEDETSVIGLDSDEDATKPLTDETAKALESVPMMDEPVPKKKAVEAVPINTVEEDEDVKEPTSEDFESDLITGSTPKNSVENSNKGQKKKEKKAKKSKFKFGKKKKEEEQKKEFEDTGKQKVIKENLDDVEDNDLFDDIDW